MKSFVLALLLIPVVLSAKPKPSPEQKALDKLLENSGGYAKFERLATLSYDFEETIQTSSGPLVTRGRRLVHVGEGGSFRAREERSDGVVKVEFSRAPGEGGRLSEDLFWLFVPQRIKREDRPLTFMSRGFFLGRLLDRLSVGGGPFFPGGEDLILYLHPDSGTLLGASYGDETAKAAFLPQTTTESLLVVPSGRVHYDGAEKRTRSIKISNVVVNGFVDEGLFTQGETP